MALQMQPVASRRAPVFSSPSGRSRCPQRVTTYGSNENCKSKRNLGKKRKRDQRARREYTRLLNGMAGHQSWFITLTKRRGWDIHLRQNAWHILLTRMRQRWPSMEAWTVVEYAANKRGVHLHVVVRGTPDLSEEWLAGIVKLLRDQTSVHVEPVGHPQHLASYLTKQLTDAAIQGAWPRYFRPVTVTRGWDPDSRGRRNSVREAQDSCDILTGDAAPEATPVALHV